MGNMRNVRMNWESPKTCYQEFAPQEYVAYCYMFDAELVCVLGQRMGYDAIGGGQHGAPCADTHFHVNGKTGEETGDKDGNPIYAINVPGISEENNVGDIIRNCTWQSDDPTPNVSIKTYYHNGYAVIQSKVEILPGRPNHS